MRRGNATLGSVAPFTMIALVANIGLYVLSGVRSGDFFNINSNVLIALGASIREGMWEGEWIRMVAPMFLHGGALHILFNMSFLWRAGPDAESYFGTPNFGTIYLLSGATGICFSQIFSGNLAIGASTSLCGIMGAHLAVLIVNSPVPRNAWRNSNVRAVTYNLLFLLAIGIFGLLPLDNWGHFGGMVGGLMLGGSFEAWRLRKAAGKIGVFVSILLIAALICAARWTVFNPTYHIYQAAIARDRLKDEALAQKHSAEALKWGRTWSWLHFVGVLNEEEAQNILNANTRGDWHLKGGRRVPMLGVEDFWRGRAMPLPKSIDESELY